MPYRSDAQRKFFNANRAKLEKQGVDVDEWNKASKGKDLPEHASRDKDDKEDKDEFIGEYLEKKQPNKK